MRQRLLFWVLLSFAMTALAGPLEDGLKAYHDGQYPQAIQLLTPLAKQNNSRAQFVLGMMSYHGQGVPEDEKAAVEWLGKAAATGYVEAMYALGNLYLVGHEAAKLSAEPDHEAAIWYYKAAAAGHAQAQYQLGLLFLAGQGVIRDDDIAMLWFKKAAAQGHVEAQRSLEVMRKGK